MTSLTDRKVNDLFNYSFVILDKEYQTYSMVKHSDKKRSELFYPMIIQE